MRNRAAEACPWRRLSSVLTDDSSWDTFDGRGTQGRSRDTGGPQRGEDHILVSSVVDTWSSFLSLTFQKRIWEPGNSRDAEPTACQGARDTLDRMESSLNSGHEFKSQHSLMGMNELCPGTR